MSFAERVDEALVSREKAIWEGAILSINRMVSDAIKVPEGDYRVLIKDCDRCVLIPTNEASKQEFEVLRPTLAGFFNPEVHRKVVSPSGNILSEKCRAINRG